MCGSSSPVQRESALVWDQTSHKFWATSGVNAYDIPEAGDWQREFGVVKQMHGVIAARRAGLTNPEHALSMPSDSVRPEPKKLEEMSSSPPSTPTRRKPQASLWGTSPAFDTPPKSLERRTNRAAHTAALKAVRETVGLAGLVQVVCGRELVFFRFGGRVFAAEARCPHQGGNLAEGEVGDIEDMASGRTCYVTCPVHKMRFDLGSGRVLDGNCSPLKVYDVRIGEADCEHKFAQVQVGFDALDSSYFEAFE
eukprot:TRINITY_DN79471_c0_g1_i1.p1 TRINITY_DN79471_c0_g1~~TRINITY_DN79471_c0_g1_i1.p1  ORF type:complete len:252 (-),score=39.53 TRINITY_DN79471_c0_g1_i1:58-813(-)